MAVLSLVVDKDTINRATRRGLEQMAGFPEGFLDNVPCRQEEGVLIFDIDASDNDEVKDLMEDD